MLATLVKFGGYLKLGFNSSPELLHLPAYQKRKKNPIPGYYLTFVILPCFLLSIDLYKIIIQEISGANSSTVFVIHDKLWRSLNILPPSPPLTPLFLSLSSFFPPLSTYFIQQRSCPLFLLESVLFIKEAVLSLPFS